MGAFGIQNMEGALEEKEVNTAAAGEGAENVDANDTSGSANDGDSNSGGDSNQEQQNNNADTPPADDIDEEKVRGFFKAKYGKEVTSFEELFQEKTATVNPYENINPELKAILDYHTETGRGISDYQQLQRDFDKVPVLELAIEKVKQEIGVEASQDDLIAYIEDELNIDLSDDELSTKDTLKLNKFVKEYRESLKAAQEKFKAPLAKEGDQNPDVEMITLDNGQKVEKTVFDAHQKQRQAYIEDMKVAVDSVAKTSLSIEFDNNGVKENYAFDYEYDQADRKSMLELTEDIDQTAANLFRTEKGFDHQGFAKSIWRLDPKNWEKEVSAIVNKAIADTTERITKNENNVNFNRNRIPNSGNSSKGKDIFNNKPKGFGIQFDI
ncbi:hypothetical protein [Flavobacterium sp. GNP002]